jgi:hypothetical protein
MDHPELFAPLTAREAALRHDATVRGTGRAREQAFRQGLWDFTARDATTLPPTLYEAMMDHLTRTDAQGLSLCFNGPLRERLLADIAAWRRSQEAPSS